MQQSFFYLTKNVKVPTHVAIRGVYHANLIYVLDDKPVVPSIKINLLPQLALYHYGQMPEKISL